MVDTSLGRALPRAKPVTLTFYDSLLDVPFTTTFYVHEQEPDERIETLIKAICDVSLCVLGQYKIGHRVFNMTDYRNRLKKIPRGVMGGQKWVVKYRTVHDSARSFTIPGRDLDLSINASRSTPIGKQGKKPNPDHPKWQALTNLVKQMCVSKQGTDLMNWIGLDYRNEAWPPKSARRR